MKGGALTHNYPSEVVEPSEKREDLLSAQQLQAALACSQ